MQFREYSSKVIHYLEAHPLVDWTIFTISLSGFVFSLFFVSWFVNHMPSDYFVHNQRPSIRTQFSHVWRLLFFVMRNALGFCLFIVGLAMLILPGQGFLTLFISFLVMDFPGKFQIERWLARKKRILGALNWIRRRHGNSEILSPKD